MNPDLTPDIRTIKLMSGEEIVAHVLSENIEINTITVEYPMKVISQYSVTGDEDGADVAVSSVLVPWFNTSKHTVMSINNNMIVSTSETDPFCREEWMFINSDDTPEEKSEPVSGNVFTFKPKGRNER